ncbi:hypothetical protein, variant 2 [Aphanomyces invadans]|uniref:Uncharacterized protein n=1 Tax=Aphanomyces invadans TaxID=157072 RepID=A0A024U6P8_9STRA|nr:hypothetical protein, variant 2 [Aphanomyces invadans]ETW02106.1 hypothetical protein, variant 2 [Aphanomyces invadans]|eukprot:XP_008868711.1 hypothetical protein, variant 2 [Aphanomyces invadans]
MKQVHVLGTHEHKAVTWQDALNEIYDANHDSHDRPLTFLLATYKLQERVYVQREFEQIMASVKMDPNLLFFEEPHEQHYVAFLNRINRRRVQLCFSVGAVACFYYFYYEVHFLNAYRLAARDDDADMDKTISGPSEIALYWLSFGLIVPTFGVGVAATFVPWGRRRLESIVTFVYLVVAIGLIAKKCIQQAKGPIYALVILVIPLFNVTRMRFAYSAAVGWAIVIIYLTVEMAAGPDTSSKTVFTSLNYSMSVVAGMVSSYQKVRRPLFERRANERPQELLKRRNFVLGLNYSGSPDDVSSRIHSPYYAKEVLCRRWTQAFKHSDLERRFYRFWYLLDANAYESVNAGILHRTAYASWRYPLTGVCLNQTVLVLQDVTNLYGTTTQLISLAFRLGCIIPGYVFLFASMKYLSQLYTTKWVESGRIRAIPSLIMKSAHQSRHWRKQPRRGSFRWLQGTVKAMRKRLSKTIERYLLNMHRGYAPTVQYITSAVVLMHISLLGTLVVLIAIHFGRRDIYSVYFQGLLNATMFSHRSTFRLRFAYSAPVTIATCLAFIAATYSVLPRRVHLEYATYLCIVQLLGMIVSYEEENLRRSFFIKKSLRALEFRANFQIRTMVSPWIRAKMVQLGRQAKDAVRDSADENRSVVHNPRPLPTTPTQDSSSNFLTDKNLRDLQSRLNRNHVVITNIRPRFSQASKYAVYTTCGNLCVALGQVVYFLVTNK